MVGHMESFNEYKENNTTIKQYSQNNVDDLLLYINSSGELYRSHIESIRKNLSRKHKAGKYDTKLACDIWLPAVEAGVKLYETEYGSVRDESFSDADIKQTNLQLKTEWEEEMNIGNYE